MWRIGPCLLMDTEQNKGLPYMATLINVKTSGEYKEETIIFEEAVNDKNILGWDVMKWDNKEYVRSLGRDKIWNALMHTRIECKYMKFRDFLNYIGSLCTNRGGAKDRTPNPMISWSRDCDLDFLYNLDQYLPGEKFFKCNPRINPSGCSDNVHWKKRIPQVCAQRFVVELCPKFYSDVSNLKNVTGPSTLEQCMRRIDPSYIQTHMSDKDTEDMARVLVHAIKIDGSEIPRESYMYAKTDSITKNL